MINKIIWLIINYTLLFDSINGFFLHNGQDLFLSQGIKIILVFLILLKLITAKYRIYAIPILCYPIFLFIYWSTICPWLLGDSVNTLFKFLSVILIFLYIKREILLRPDYTLLHIDKAIKINMIVLSVNILSGLFNIGYSQYGGEIGSRGYFYSGNEISGVILLLCPYLLYQIWIKKYIRSIKYYLLSLALLMVALFSTTKTAILGVLISFFLIPYLRSNSSHTHKKNRKWLIPILSISIGVSAYYGITYSGIADRWSFFYEKDGLLGLVLSGRDITAREYMVKFLSSDSLQKFLGLGRIGTVEIDPFDTLFHYGFLGIIVVYSFYLYLLIHACTHIKRKTFPYASLVCFIDILILFASSIAGHIIFSGMSGVFIALINGLIFYKKQHQII